MEFRKNRKDWQTVIRDYLLTGQAKVMVVSDDYRLARNERDGLDLIDAATVSGDSVVAPDDNWEPRWILRDGGTDAEQETLRNRISDARRYSASIKAKVKMGRRRWAGRSSRERVGTKATEWTPKKQSNSGT